MTYSDRIWMNLKAFYSADRARTVGPTIVLCTVIACMSLGVIDVRAEGNVIDLTGQALTARRHNLDCDALGTTCVIRGMPFFSQSDRRIDPILDKYLERFPEDRLPLTKSGARMSRKDARQSLKAGGCYDSAMVSIMVAGLGNRSTKVGALKARSKYFAELEPTVDTKGRETPRILHQVAWQYYEAFNGQNKVQDAGRVIQPLYFHEIVADIGGGKIKENCDPYIYGNCSVATAINGLASAFRKFRPAMHEVNAPELVRLMRANHGLLLAYERMRIVKRIDAARRVTFISLQNINNHHKVAVAGFRPGDFPLLINNVGSGKLEAARISTNLADAGVVAKAGTKIVMEPKFAGRPFIAFEGAQPSDLVYVIEHADGLRIDAQR